MKTDLTITIMAGGAGARFWPLSTEDRPKPFLKLFGARSLLQQSYDRVSDLVPNEAILVLTNERFVPLVKDQLPQIPTENIVGEPVRRDTAAAVALAALISRKNFGNPVMGVMTADHLIESVDAFQKTLLSAVNTARTEGGLYTIGIEPTHPATGYGYLETADELLDDQGVKHYPLKRFKEKPDAVTAASYIESGSFLWNSGMFVWQVDDIIAEFQKNLPEHFKHLGKAVDSFRQKGWKSNLKTAMEAVEPISIDYGIMEKADTVKTVASVFSWSDVGGWAAMQDHLKSDADNNKARGRLATLDADSNLVFCEEPSEMVALVGVKDLIVVRSGNRTMIVDKSRCEDVKKLVASLDEDDR